MKIIVKNISLPYTLPEAAARQSAEIILGRAKIPYSEIRLYRRSTDARKKNDIRFVYSYEADCESLPSLSGGDISISADETVKPIFGKEKRSSPPAVVGFGPAGMLCALILSEYGYNPVVIERGKDIDSRKKAVEEFYHSRKLNPECNIQFGAGGAGTFSDGKLVSRINDPLCRYVLDRFTEFGADNDITVNAKPHIGTDVLSEIVRNITAKITENGGKILFDTKFTGFKNGKVITDGGEIPACCAILATGHSSRDTYDLLEKAGIVPAPKPFSVGVRIEHLQSDIDKAMYGDCAGDPLLGHAEYALSHRVGERGVYTFCMCPGGEVVAAASEEGGVVTNGMSRRARDGRNANAAIAVSVQSDRPVEFQRMLERAAFCSGGKNYSAPCQTVGDFLSGKSGSRPARIQPTYMNGAVEMTDLSKIIPPDITEMLKSGIIAFDRKIKGFAAPDALLTGIESRTSSPYRLERTERRTSVFSDFIYPCGEGAGYAGGIMSSAIDGIKTALAVIERFCSN